jgi:ubiquitin carboxyl-terminal hydrolase 22/27/51
MSSILQCLLNCSPLEKLFLHDFIHPYQSCEALRGNKQGCLACGFDEVFLEYFGSSNGIDAIAALEENDLSASSLSCSRFVYDENVICTKGKDKMLRGHPLIIASLLADTWKQVEMKVLAGQNQNDAQEFFSAFVNSVADGDLSYQKLCISSTQLSCPTQVTQPTLDERNKSPDQGLVSKIKSIFTGSLRSTLVCQQCGRKRTQVESFLNISLYLITGPPHTQSVENCLDHMTKQETLTDLVHCPKCKMKTKSSQQQAFATLPEVLCLHLKRFDSVTNKKITDAVSFPAHGLDMGQYLAHW